MNVSMWFKVSIAGNPSEDIVGKPETFTTNSKAISAGPNLIGIYLILK